MDLPAVETTAHLYQYNIRHAREITCLAQSSENDTAAQNMFRNVRWSPDGSAIAASTEDSTLRIYDLNDVVSRYAAQTGLETKTACAASTSISHRESLLDYSWYPFMNRQSPETCCLVESLRDHPVQLRDSNTGSVRASYVAYDSKEVLMSASALAFSTDGTGVFAGYAGHIGRFDVQRPGLPVELTTTSPSRRSRDGMKGIVSCMAPGISALACGSFSGQVGLYTSDGGVMAWSVPDEYRGAGVTELRWAPNNVHLWAASRKAQHIVAWDIRDLRSPCMVLPRESPTPQRMGFGFDATGRYLVAGEPSGQVAFHDICDQGATAPLRLQAHQDLVSGTATHPFYPLLATCSGQRHVGQELAEDAGPGAATSYGDCSLCVWAVPAGYLAAATAVE